MNSAFYEYYREGDIPASLSRMLFSLARLRVALLGKLGWRGLIRFSQQGALLKDVLRGVLLVPFQGTNCGRAGCYAWPSVPTSSGPQPRT